MPRFRVNFAGMRLGNLTVLEPVADPARPNASYWLCKCDCGAFARFSSTALSKRIRTDCDDITLCPYAMARHRAYLDLRKKRKLKARQEQVRQEKQKQKRKRREKRTERKEPKAAPPREPTEDIGPECPEYVEPEYADRLGLLLPPSRKCHDCHRPTDDYRCPDCLRAWRLRNGVAMEPEMEEGI